MSFELSREHLGERLGHLAVSSQVLPRPPQVLIGFEHQGQALSGPPAAVLIRILKLDQLALPVLFAAGHFAEQQPHGDDGEHDQPWDHEQLHDEAGRGGLDRGEIFGDLQGIAVRFVDGHASSLGKSDGKENR